MSQSRVPESKIEDFVEHVKTSTGGPYIRRVFVKISITHHVNEFQFQFSIGEPEMA